MLANTPVADPHEADRIVSRFTWSRRFRSAVGITLGGLAAGGLIAAVVELNRASVEGRAVELFDVAEPLVKSPEAAPDPEPEPVATPMTTPEELPVPEVKEERDHPAPTPSAPPKPLEAEPAAIPLPFDGAPDYMVIGHRLRARGEHHQALKAFERAAERGRPDADALYWMGRTYEELGKPVAAVHAFRRALHANPNHAEATRALAQALQRQGQTSQAITVYRRYVALEPTSTETLDIISSLEAQPQ